MFASLAGEVDDRVLEAAARAQERDSCSRAVPTAPITFSRSFVGLPGTTQMPSKPVRSSASVEWIQYGSSTSPSRAAQRVDEERDAPVGADGGRAVADQSELGCGHVPHRRGSSSGSLSIEDAVRYGVAWPRMDISPWISAMSRVTSHVGFGLTYATTFMHPFYVARLLNSLDHLTNGRIAFNVITSNARQTPRTTASTN